MKKIKKNVIGIIKKFIKGFTLIELLVVIAIIAILTAIVLVVLSGPRDKANAAVAKQTVESVVRQVEIASTEGGGILAPVNNSTGGGPICSSCTSTETWPSIEKTGYTYNVVSDPDISDGSYSFSVTKADKPTVSASVVGGVGKIQEIPAVVSGGGGGGGSSGGGGSGGGGGSPPVITKSLSGNIAYYSSGFQITNPYSPSTVNDIVIGLKQNGITMYTATTPVTGNGNTLGNYSFPAVAQGTYDVYFSKPELPIYPPITISSSDSLITQFFISNPSVISGISILAADVYQNSSSSIITIDDKQAITNKVIGAISSFAPGSWVFTKAENAATPYSSFPIPFATSGGFSNISITIGDTDIVQNFSTRAFGDVNGT